MSKHGWVTRFWSESGNAGDECVAWLMFSESEPTEEMISAHLSQDSFHFGLSDFRFKFVRDTSSEDPMYRKIWGDIQCLEGDEARSRVDDYDAVCDDYRFESMPCFVY